MQSSTLSAEHRGCVAELKYKVVIQKIFKAYGQKRIMTFKNVGGGLVDPENKSKHPRVQVLKIENNLTRSLKKHLTWKTF